MIIDVWSDVVCPWCFIGKRRLEKAVAKLPAGIEVQIRHRAFELQPGASGVTPVSEMLASKYGVDQSKVSQMHANVCSIAEGEGLCYDLEKTNSGNTFDAHRLLLWAESQGKQAELLEAMYSSHFEHGANLFSHEDLLAVSREVGLSEVDVRSILDSDKYSDDVSQDGAIARRLGAGGVPFFVFDMN